jgi:hypothetical protein
VLAEDDIGLVNMHGLWSLLGKEKTMQEAHKATTTRVKGFVKRFCDAAATPAAKARTHPFLLLWTLTNAIVDTALHTDPNNEHPSMYEANCRNLNAFEVEFLQLALKKHMRATAQNEDCGRHIVLVDMHSLTLPVPGCTPKHGDGRHYIQVQPHVWNWLGNAIAQWSPQP